VQAFGRPLNLRLISENSDAKQSDARDRKGGKTLWIGPRLGVFTDLSIRADTETGPVKYRMLLWGGGGVLGGVRWGGVYMVTFASRTFKGNRAAARQ